MKLKYDSWDKVTLDVYNKIKAISDDTEMDDMEKNVALVALMYDTSVTALYDIPINKLNKMITGLEWLKEPPKFVIKEKYEINGRTYVLNVKMADFTVAQFTDYQNYLKMENNTHLLLSVFLIPKGCKYNRDYDLEQAQRDMKDLGIIDVKGITDFFSVAFAVLFKSTMDSSIRRMKKAMKKEKNPQKKSQLNETIQRMESLRRSM